ncbi:hypothetical protein AV530_004938 [Patagioenas fasciata monilis]|uniref:Uncharacterized protein n=1 Tax=Patagioenas fasciata monilis TaxID=372326 RepID=A0A1V4K3C1_PATFA|nr:hypothetical protein AV530_004938 [Patagioenas fasciata monilis]
MIRQLCRALPATVSKSERKTHQFISGLLSPTVFLSSAFWLVPQLNQNMHAENVSFFCPIFIFFAVDSSSPGAPKSLRWDSFTTRPRCSIGGVISWDSLPERDRRIHHYKICISLWGPEQLRKITGKWLILHIRCRVLRGTLSKDIFH